MNKKKIVITGGHAATTALATIESLNKDNDWDIYWIGAKKTIEGKKIRGIEETTFPKYNIHYKTITSGRLQRKFTRFTIPSLLKVPVGFWQSLLLINKIKPDIVLSFGGYIALPVVLVAYFKRIPVVIHEQVSEVGLANKITSPFAKKIAISRSGSSKYFKPEKVVLTGNPIMSRIRNLPTKTKKNPVTTIFITGGSRGSQIINNSVMEALPTLLSKYKVIHQTGLIDFERVSNFKKNMSKKISDNYTIFSVVEHDKMHDLYKKADIVIGRSGANTVSEVMSVGIPAIFIPIPWTRYNEQTINASLAVEAGVAEMISQDELNSKTLTQKIQIVEKNWPNYVKNSHTNEFKKLDMQASEKLSELVKSVLK